MRSENYKKLYALETTPEALDASCRYLTQRLGQIVKKQEQVLVCFPDQGPKSFGNLLGRAIRACDAEPVFWGPDYRWKTLLRQAFQRHTETIVAPPWVILGLMKLSQHTKTPLYICDAVLGGYPYAQWLVEGIKKGLDCRVWGCYAARSGPVVVGFTCNQEAGIHIRDDILDAVIVDEAGKSLVDSKRGKFLMISKKDKSLAYDPEETSILMRQPCSCGCDAPRILDIFYSGAEYVSLSVLERRLLTWSSVLDCRAKNTESGMELELVVFPDAQLPEIPSCAKLTLRPWNPEKDEPLCLQELLTKYI